jgi:hypothetical protein
MFGAAFWGNSYDGNAYWGPAGSGVLPSAGLMLVDPDLASVIASANDRGKSEIDPDLASIVIS